MKFFISIIILFFLCFTLTGEPGASGPVVAVCGLENPSGDKIAEVVGSAVKDTILLTLKLIRTYDIVNEPAVIDGDDISRIRRYAEENKVDSVIFGSIRMGKGNQADIRLSVYEKLADRITVTTQRELSDVYSASVFEITDELAVELIEGFSKKHIAYGSIRFINQGEAGHYTVFMDGEKTGDTIGKLAKVFAGKHDFRIIQQRMFGEYLLKEESVSIEEDESIDCTFSIPYLTAEEKKTFYEIDRIIVTAWADINQRQKVLDAFKKAEQLLGIPELKSYADIESKYEVWKKRFFEGSDMSGDTEYNIAGALKQTRVFAEQELLSGAHKIDLLNPTLKLLEIGKAYEAKPDWEIFKKLALRKMTIDVKLIESFAEPFIGCTGSTLPDFSDDFSADTGWDRGWGGRNLGEKTSNKTINDGRLFLYCDKDQVNTQNRVMHVGDERMFAGNFILSADLSINNGWAGVCWRQTESTGDYWFNAGSDGCNIGYGTNIVLGASRIENINTGNIHFLLIVYGDAVCIYINNTPVLLLNDTGKASSDYIVLQGGMNNAMARTFVASFDNFKIWKLDTIKL